MTAPTKCKLAYRETEHGWAVLCECGWFSIPLAVVAGSKRSWRDVTDAALRHLGDPGLPVHS